MATILEDAAMKYLPLHEEKQAAVCGIYKDGASNEFEQRGHLWNTATGQGPAALACFQDFQKMFDKMGKDIDAVSVGVPDFSHFPIAMLAMSLGKHVYCEKPLGRTIEECNLMVKAARKAKIPIVTFRARPFGQPRRMSQPEIQPPMTLPMSATM